MPRKIGLKWLAEVRIRQKDLKTYKSKRFTKRSDAVRWEAQQLNEAQLMQQNKLGTIKTFADATEYYIQHHSIGKPGHRWEIIRAESLKNHPLWHKYMANITVDDLAEYRDTRLETVTPGTVLRELSFIGSIFRVAWKELKWIDHNPVNLMEKPSPPKPRTRRISPDEIDDIVKHLGWFPDSPVVLKKHQVAVLFLLAIETAMRMSEMTTLEKDQIYLDARYVHLIKTKNGDERKVPLSNAAIKLINLLNESFPDNKKLFTVSSRSADPIFRKARDKAGINDLHFHDTRREAASRLAKKLDVMDLAKMTGHRDIKMLLNVYYSPNVTEIADLLD